MTSLLRLLKVRYQVLAGQYQRLLNITTTNTVALVTKLHVRLCTQTHYVFVYQLNLTAEGQGTPLPLFHKENKNECTLKTISFR